MSSSYEWAEWHLTENGWVKGSVKTDFDKSIAERPHNAVATFKYSEEISYLGKPDAKITQTWEARDKKLTSYLCSVYGDCPRQVF